jgi:hypothetical protein
MVSMDLSPLLVTEMTNPKYLAVFSEGRSYVEALPEE